MEGRKEGRRPNSCPSFLYFSSYLKEGRKEREG
jgi:hypothetical protein